MLQHRNSGTRPAPAGPPFPPAQPQTPARPPAYLGRSRRPAILEVGRAVSHAGGLPRALVAGHSPSFLEQMPRGEALRQGPQMCSLLGLGVLGGGFEFTALSLTGSRGDFSNLGMEKTDSEPLNHWA